MEDEQKAREQLLDELAAMRQRVDELEAAVSEHKRAEEMAREANVYAESIVETVREPLLVLDSDLRVISANLSFYRTFQVTPPETENHLIYELGSRQWDIPRLRELLEEILPENTYFQDFEVDHSFPTIGHRTMVLNARKIRLEEEGPHLILLAIEDITKRMEAEEAIRKAFEQLELNVEERTVDLSKAIKELEVEATKRKLAEEGLRKTNRILRMISQSNQAVVRAPEEAELMQEFCRIIVEDGGYRLAWAGFAEQDDGKRVRPVAQAGFEEGYLDSLNITWADTERGQGPTGTAIRTGRPCVAQNILTDPRYEPLRAEANERGYSSSIALPLFDGEQVFGTLNVYAAEPDAFDKEEVELLVELASDLAYGIVAARTRVERKRTEEELRQAHEELRQHINYIEKAQDQLIRFEKLASVGQLSASISHEILNPLNVITMNLHMMLADPNTPSEMAEDLRVMQEQANRIVKISQNLLYFARQRQPERRHLELNDTIKRTLSLLQHEFRLGNIAVELKLAEGLQNIFADQDQLQQVVLNLLTNARDVMPDGGSITISTSEVEPLFLGGENAIEISVEDTGPGIDSGYMNKLFDPFFTTKPEGEGTGLGLSICHGIVKAHEGQIWAENTSGGGAAFIIRLPIGPTEESSA